MNEASSAPGLCGAGPGRDLADGHRGMHRWPLRCRCVWLGERCPNRPTQEDGLCDWCAAPGARTDQQLRENPNALVTPDGELHGIGGRGELHDAGLADSLGYGPPKACWYDLDNRTLAASPSDDPSEA